MRYQLRSAWRPNVPPLAGGPSGSPQTRPPAQISVRDNAPPCLPTRQIYLRFFSSSRDFVLEQHFGPRLPAQETKKSGILGFGLIPTTVVGFARSTPNTILKSTVDRVALLQSRLAPKRRKFFEQSTCSGVGALFRNYQANELGLHYSWLKLSHRHGQARMGRSICLGFGSSFSPLLQVALIGLDLGRLSRLSRTHRCVVPNLGSNY